MSLKNNLLAATACIAMVISGPALAQQPEDGLLFRFSADQNLTADYAGGQAEPTFADKVKIIGRGGVAGGYLQAPDDQVLAWSAPGNIQAQRGTLSFFWRARYPLGSTEFPLFRVAYANHSSWDMVFLRIDWNGHGFDAFVTDANLARVRVSWKAPAIPAPDAWTHIAFAWDEATGIQLYINGTLAERKDQPATLDAGLDQFGPHSRIIAPIQVQSRYNFLRGGDLDEIRIYDHALAPDAVATLARAQEPRITKPEPDWQQPWALRLGFGPKDPAPPYLASSHTRIRKVEIKDQRDIAQRMWKGNDGIRETTWPGVYNRSRLPGRTDYFILPDWNVYSAGGKEGTWFLPDEPWNRVEIQGAAHGRLSVLRDATVPEAKEPVTAPATELARRREGTERSTTQLAKDEQGGAVRFTNDAQEVPIQEIGVYHVGPGKAPETGNAYSFTVRAEAEPDYPAIAHISRFIDGRYPVAERALAVALPKGGPMERRTVPATTSQRPLVHIAIPMDFRRQGPGKALRRGTTQGYENAGGLDGVELTIPALNLPATHKGLIPLNIRIKDPLTPERDLADVNVAVKPGEARTLWLDTRDRILPPDGSVYLTIATVAPGFGLASLDGMDVRLLFKSREEALAEHVADRFEQVRDNYGFLVEERQSTRELGLFNRFYEDLTDLLRADPTHKGALAYWSEWNPQQPLPAVQIEPAPAGIPAWAWGQTQYLAQVRDFVHWWIDHRQVDGEFGGGLSDDTDLTNQWPGLALMGVTPDKVNTSLSEMIEAIYANGMFTKGLGTIVTDELHVYEEGINAISQSAYMNWGDPLTMERLMETAINYSRLTEVNPKGNRLLVSNYFGGDRIVRETPWQWSKPYSYMIFHPGVLLVDYNGSPALKKLLLELADGYLAHGKQDAQGRWDFPSEINWPDGATRGTAGPEQTNLLMWAAWRWTGDEKYLRPLDHVLRRSGLGGLSGIVNSDLALDLKRPDLRTPLVTAAGQRDANPFTLHTAWTATGDKRYLEQQYDQQRRWATWRWSMMTEDHWWVDRVELPAQELQRQRLGGVALWRNAIVRGHRISWQFAQPDDATKLAILVREPTRTGFRVIAYNLSDAPITATIQGGDVAKGNWRMSQGIDTNGDDKADTSIDTRTIRFGDGIGTDVQFAPRQTKVLEFTLAGDEIETRNRPDIAIASRDLSWDRQGLKVKVHSLGSQPTPTGRARLLDADGKVLAEAPIPALAAPNDLLAKTADILIPVGKGQQGVRVELVLDGDPVEITDTNNQAQVPQRP